MKYCEAPEGRGRLMKVYLCDCSREYLERVRRKVEAILYSGRIGMEFGGAFACPEELLGEIRKTGEAGLYILDTGREGSCDGIDLACRIRKYDSRGFIVFLTNHSELASRVLKCRAEIMDFIIKGEREEEELRKCILTAMERYTSKSNRFEKLVRFRTDNGLLWQDTESIVYAVTAERTRWLELHLRDGECREVIMTLKELMEELQGGDFEYCYRGCIVNRAYIAAFDDKDNFLLLKNGERLDVSVRCRKYFR